MENFSEEENSNMSIDDSFVSIRKKKAIIISDSDEGSGSDSEMNSETDVMLIDSSLNRANSLSDIQNSHDKSCIVLDCSSDINGTLEMSVSDADGDRPTDTVLMQEKPSNKSLSDSIHEIGDRPIFGLVENMPSDDISLSIQNANSLPAREKSVINSKSESIANISLTDSESEPVSKISATVSTVSEFENSHFLASDEGSDFPQPIKPDFVQKIIVNERKENIVSISLDIKAADTKLKKLPAISHPFSKTNLKDECIVLSSDQESAEVSNKPSSKAENLKNKMTEKSKIKGIANPKEKIITLQNDINSLKYIFRSTNIETLPDRGIRLQIELNDKEKRLKELKDEFKNAQGTKAVLEPVKPENSKKLQSTNFPSDSFEPQSMGAKAMETYRVQKALTMDALQQLHASLETCPDENTFAEDPKGLRSTIQLMPHQKRALAWLLWRENKRPRGGILADDMGLGKTLTMISLVLAKKENKEKYKYSSSEEDSDVEDKENWFSRDSNLRGGTLVICPASLLNQWENEIQKKCKDGTLDIEVYHGTNREDRSRRLARRDVVITTYNLVRSEESKSGLLFKMKWERIILDEAHVIRNHKSKCSLAICRLKSHFKWVLTGTPIQNKEQDMYALLKFLRCSPFDDLSTWKKWVDNKNSSGQQRLTTLLNTLMLRRTKQQLQEMGTIQCLPDKTMEVIDVTLDKEEFEVYEQVLHLSKSLFAQFLHQKASKEQGLTARFSDMPTYLQKPGPDNPFKLNSELAALHAKMNNMPIVKSFEILMLLLRLRQLCCHASLISSLMDRETCELDGMEYEKNSDFDVVSQFSSLDLQDNSGTDSQEVTSQSSEKRIFSPNNPVFQEARASSKMRMLFEILEEKVLCCGDKAVIISQWTSMLKILEDHLRDRGVSCVTLSGSVAVKDRMGIVDSFNKPNTKPQVLLLSLTAGGVGLNLIGGNHLFLFDLHWNPQLEAQACDRVYRVGQTKSVFIYKFVCEETIEQMISQLQKKKVDMADAVLTGARHTNVNKLSLEDLRMIFNL